MKLGNIVLLLFSININVIFILLSASSSSLGLPLWSASFENEDPCTSKATMRSPSDGELLSFHFIVLHVQCKPQCYTPGSYVALHIDDFPEPAATFSCDQSLTHSAVLHTTRDKWVGDFSALVRTVDREGDSMDQPYRVEFRVFIPPGSEPKNTAVRVTPWAEEYSSMFGFHDYTMLTPTGTPQPSSLQIFTSNNTKWCIMERVMFDDGHFLLVDEGNHLELPAPWHPTMGTAKHWGPRRGVAFERYMAPGPRCDRTIHKNAFFFGMAQLDDHVEVLNAAFLALYATILETVGEIDAGNTVLITNVGAPVESGLGRYLPLFRILSVHPIISISELRSHGILCFDKVVFGLSGSYDLLSPTVDVSRVLPDMNLFVRKALDIGSGEEEENVEHSLLWVSRSGSRNVVNEAAILELARRLGFVAKAVRFEEHSVEEQIAMVHNVSVLMGIAGAGLANALWMKRGSVVVQLLPFGYGDHMGEEIVRIAEQGPGHYLSMHLPAEANGHWPWNAPEIATTDPNFLWNWHAPGHGPGEEDEGGDHDEHGHDDHQHDHNDQQHGGAHKHSHRSHEDNLHYDYSGTHGHATAVLLYSGVKDITVDVTQLESILVQAKRKLVTKSTAAWIPNAPQMAVPYDHHRWH